MKDSQGFRAFILIWIVQLLARVGNGLTAFALSVHAFQLTGQASAVAWVTLAAFLPTVLLAPVAGVIADRVDRRLMMIVSSAFSTLGLVALLLAIRSGSTSIGLLSGCVAFSAIFTAALDPAYRATVTDLLPPDQFARAAGLVQLASAAQFIVSPALAGLLMAGIGIDATIVVDIATMATTTLGLILVWRMLKTMQLTQPASSTGSALADFRTGMAYLARNRGVSTLVAVIALVTFCMGVLQTLLTPMMLDLTTETTLGIIRSVAAIGMIVSSLIISLAGMGSGHTRYLALGLAAGGLLIALMGLTTNVTLIGVLAFGFFMTLPPLNTSVEVMIRSAIPAGIQGKLWGLIGMLSQLGYIAAYAVSGILADKVFTPLLLPGGMLSGSVGTIVGVGPSRGIGLMFVLVGLAMAMVASIVPRLRSVRKLEHGVQQLEETVR